MRYLPLIGNETTVLARRTISGRGWLDHCLQPTIAITAWEVTSASVHMLLQTKSAFVTKRLFFFVIIVVSESCSQAFRASFCRQIPDQMKQATMDDVNSSKAVRENIIVGFTTDAWNVGMRKYKDFLAVYKMIWKVQNHDVQCVEVCEKWDALIDEVIARPLTLTLSSFSLSSSAANNWMATLSFLCGKISLTSCPYNSFECQ